MFGDRRLPIDGPLAAALANREGHLLTAGLRAEHWRIGPATNRNLEAEVSHCEVLGNEQILTCRLKTGGDLVQVRLDADQSIASGDVVHLDPDPTGWRLFEDDGQAVVIPDEITNEVAQLPQMP